MTPYLGIDKIFFVNHHTCHAYYAYFASINKFTECAVLTMDSYGDYLNQTVWTAKKDKQVLHKIVESDECDVARIYKITTLLLSMKPDEHEYKVMGMAPYAKQEYAQEVYENVFKDILKVENCKVLRKNRPEDMYKYLKNNKVDVCLVQLIGTVGRQVKNANTKEIYRWSPHTKCFRAFTHCITFFT